MFRNDMILNMGVVILYHVHIRKNKINRHFQRLLLRKQHVRGSNFNLNVFSENQSLADLRFTKKGVAKVAI